MVTDFNKFKRLFVFGCSYTNYKWPTWAHVLNSEIDGCEFYNFGKTGAGNLFISLRIAEANKRYKFNEHDLVGVMWTSFTREDRWIDGKWVTPGNIYNQSLYSTDWVKDFSDPNFYLIRDYALMDMTKTYLQSLPCTSLIMTSWPIDLLENNDIKGSFSEKILYKTKEIYYDNILELPLDLRTWQVRQYNLNMNSPQFYLYGHSYTINGNLIKDGHPNTQSYHEYLEFLGLPLTDKSKQYVDVTMKKMKHCHTDQDLSATFDKECYIPDNLDTNRIF
jgi:hypothetical protein